MEKKYIGCKVSTIERGEPQVKTTWYDCKTIKEAVGKATELLKTNYQVTIYSGNYYGPRSYTSKKEILKDFTKLI